MERRERHYQTARRHLGKIRWGLAFALACPTALVVWLSIILSTQRKEENGRPKALF